MLKLVNFSNHSSDLDKFSRSFDEMGEFFRRHGLDGFELIQNTQWKEADIPASMIQGLHMRFWPMWLDFWRKDEKELLRQFGSKISYRDYYGGESWKSILDYYREEIKTACEINVRYVVFHVSHVQLEHCFNYDFTYSDAEIIQAFIDMMNELLEGVDAQFEVLLENQWWPGLTLLDKGIAATLMEGIRYPRKGFMFDIGHMMNTNLELKSEEEAAAYILHVLEGLEEMSVYIKGIHLNSSLSGDYVKKAIEQYRAKAFEKSFFDRYLEAYGHILQIDRHKLFGHSSIRAVIDFIHPKYLVYEFITDSFSQLDEYIEQQNRILGL